MNSNTVIQEAVRSFLGTCFLVFLAAIAAFGQAGRGSISGTVRDPAGAVVVGAKVILLDHATGATQHTVTSAGGLYSFISHQLYRRLAHRSRYH